MEHIELDMNEKHHMFVLSADLLGTKLIHKAFGDCEDVVSLPSDLELMLDTQTFPPPIFDDPNFFIKERELLESGNDAAWNHLALNMQYTWATTKPDAKYRLGKSLYDFLRPHILMDYFPLICFLIMVKNPYACIAEILEIDSSLESEIENIAEQVMHTLIIQRKNNYLLGNNFAFTYEDMCTKAEWVEEKIKEQYGIDDFKLDVTDVPSSEELINNLTDFQIEVINESFKKAHDTLRYWGYELVTRDEE